MDLLGMLMVCGAFPVGLLAFLLWMARLEDGLPEAVRRTARRPDPPPILAIPVRPARVEEATIDRPLTAPTAPTVPTVPTAPTAPTTPALTPAPVLRAIAGPAAPAPRIPAQRTRPAAEERPGTRAGKAGHTGAEV